MCYSSSIPASTSLFLGSPVTTQFSGIRYALGYNISVVIVDIMHLFISKGLRTFILASRQETVLLELFLCRPLFWTRMKRQS